MVGVTDAHPRPNSARATGPRSWPSPATRASCSGSTSSACWKARRSNSSRFAPLGDPIEIRLGNYPPEPPQGRSRGHRPFDRHFGTPRLTPAARSTLIMLTTTLTVALVGNPNTGKSTLFNALSGLRQRVGNYPGVTVEMKKGQFTADGVDGRPHRPARHLQPRRAQPRRDGRGRSAPRPPAGGTAAGRRRSPSSMPPTSTATSTSPPSCSTWACRSSSRST